MADNNLTAFNLGYNSILPATVCAFGVISHLFLIVAFIKDPLKCFKNSGTYLVANLAVSDFLVSLIAPTQFFIPTNWFTAREHIVDTGIIISIYTIASISLDCFLMVVYPLKHRVLMKKRTIVVWLACIWLVSCLLPMKTLVFSLQRDTNAYITHFLEVAPILLSTTMYALTLHKLKKQSNNLALENISDRQQHARILKQKQFLRTIIIIACIAVVCIVPSTIYHHYNMFQNLFTDSQGAQVLSGISFGIFFVNFAINPLVYVLRLPNYRRTFYFLYSCKTRRC